MSCLKDYIGIKVCSTTESPESGIFINSLPGINLQSVDATASNDQVTYLQLWSDVQDEAFARFETDFMAELNRCFELNAYCDYENLICVNKRRLIQPWKYLLGNQLMLFRIFSSRLNRFTTVDLKKAEELRDYYQVEYEKNLTQAVKLCDLCDCKMDCGGDPQTVTWLP